MPRHRRNGSARQPRSEYQKSRPEPHFPELPRPLQNSVVQPTWSRSCLLTSSTERATHTRSLATCSSSDSYDAHPLTTRTTGRAARRPQHGNPLETAGGAASTVKGGTNNLIRRPGPEGPAGHPRAEPCSCEHLRVSPQFTQRARKHVGGTALSCTAARRTIPRQMDSGAR